MDKECTSKVSFTECAPFPTGPRPAKAPDTREAICEISPAPLNPGSSALTSLFESGEAIKMQ